MASARVVGKNATFWLSQSVITLVDVSADGNEIVLNLELNNEDSTGFGVSWREFTLIDGTWTIDYSAFYAIGTGLISEVFLGGPAMATLWDKRLFEFYPNGGPMGITKPKYSGSVYLASFPITAPRSGLVTVRARLNGASPLARAVS